MRIFQKNTSERPPAQRTEPEKKSPAQEKEERIIREQNKKALELSCYVCGAGAFGVFFRWLQDQTAFNEAGLAEKSVFHVLVPLFILAVALYFLRYVDRTRNDRWHLPEDFCGALENKGTLFTVFRWLAGGMMCVGALLLLADCETDKQAGMLRVLALLGLLSGLAYPLLLTAANHPVSRPRLLCLLSFLPILMFAFWLITSYKMNDINSVVWSYAIEIVAVIAAMLAFFRLAGFAFGEPNAWRSMFAAMFGTFLCVMTLADERYMGMQLMLLSSGLMLVLWNWIMVKNLRQKEQQAEVQPEDGFERL